MTKGVYQLLIRLDTDETIPVGKLGTFAFPAGFYVYTGSAMGGLDARIARHLSRIKRFHWHIDYLLERTSVIRYAIGS
jgi:Uri superfamily endonuclease